MKKFPNQFICRIWPMIFAFLAAHQAHAFEAIAVSDDVVAIDALHKKFLATPVGDLGALDWLATNLDSLPALFRYEFSRRLNVAGRQEEALRELARARLLRDMDHGECVRKDRNTRVSVMGDFTDLLETSIHNTSRHDQKQWYAAIAEALSWASDRSNQPSALWLCGEGNLKDRAAAAQGRKAAYEFLKADFARLQSPAKPPEVQQISGIEVIDTGIEVYRSTNQFQAVWLDNQRIMFSEELDAFAYTKSRSEEHLQIVTYNVVTREKVVYGKGKLRCVKDGRIGYDITIPDPKIGGRSQLVHGEIGKESPAEIPTNTHFFHSGDCAVREKAPEDRTGWITHYLNREHGYITGGKAGLEAFSTDAVWHLPGKRPITLPFVGANIGTLIHWSKYFGGYLVQYGGRPQAELPRGYVQPASETRLLTPDGKVTVFPRTGRQMKNHVLRFKYGVTREGNVGDSGIYLIDGDSPTMIHSGLILATGSSDLLSPDGCRMAFGSRQGSAKEVAATLAILNVCAEK